MSNDNQITRRQLVKAGGVLALTTSGIVVAQSAAHAQGSRPIGIGPEASPAPQSMLVDPVVTIGPEVPITQSSAIRQIPHAFAHDVVEGGETKRRVIVAWNQSADDPTAAAVSNHRITTDDGVTWSSYRDGSNPRLELSSGDLWSVSYSGFMIPGSGNTQMEIGYRISDDGWETWNELTGVLETPVPMLPKASADPTRDGGGFVFHRNAFQDSSGAIYTSAYGNYASDTVLRTILVKSTDLGASWSVVSTISYHPGLDTDPNYRGLHEPCVIRLPGGDLLAVLRSGSVSHTESLSLYQARSFDGGLTWTAPAAMTTTTGTSMTGIHPSLVLMGNGVLALSTGRPNMRLYLSTDGTGATWGDAIVTFTPQRTSGNGEIVPLDSDRLMLVGDRGKDSQNPDPYRVWFKIITVEFAFTFEQAAAMTNYFAEEGLIGRRQQHLLLTHLAVAERLAIRGQGASAAGALNRFDAVSSGISDGSVQVALLAASRRLSDQM